MNNNIPNLEGQPLLIFLIIKYTTMEDLLGAASRCEDGLLIIQSCPFVGANSAAQVKILLLSLTTASPFGRKEAEGF